MALVLVAVMTVFVAASAFGQQPALPVVMDAYAALRRSLQERLPTLAVTDRPEEIDRAERLLAERIREARAGAGRGVAIECVNVLHDAPDPTSKSAQAATDVEDPATVHGQSGQ